MRTRTAKIRRTCLPAMHRGCSSGTVWTQTSMTRAYRRTSLHVVPTKTAVTQLLIALPRGFIRHQAAPQLCAWVVRMPRSPPTSIRRRNIAQAMRTRTAKIRWTCQPAKHQRCSSGMVRRQTSMMRVYRQTGLHVVPTKIVVTQLLIARQRGCIRRPAAPRRSFSAATMQWFHAMSERSSASLTMLR